MALADLTSKIRNDATTKRDEILAAAERRAAERKAEGNREREALQQGAAAERERALADNERRVVAMAEQEVKLAQETTRRQLIATTFTKAHEALVGDDTTHQRTLEALLATLPKGLTADVRVPKGKRPLVERALKSAGIKTGTVTEDTALSSGCVLVGDDFEYDLTFDRIITDASRRLDVEVAQKLFTN